MGISLLLFFILGVIAPSAPSDYPGYVDWNTIVTLAGLLLLTTAIKESGFFYHLARRMLRKIRLERTLAVFLISASALLSMVLTNDVSLFVIIPLTLSVQKITGNDFLKLIVFEAIAVNVGSTLTPIGNPQNIFLWHQWKISFPAFIWHMLPLEILLFALLLLFVFFTFPPSKLTNLHQSEGTVNRRLFGFSATLFFLFLLSIELKWHMYFFPVLLFLYLLFFRRILRKTNWCLIFLFIFVFIDVHLVSRLAPVNRLFTYLNLKDARILFTGGVVASQFVSNVPAAILLAKFSHNWQTIAYAVNVGGNGLIIGSFANLIAMHFIENKSKYALFHRYSLPFFLLSTLLAFLIFP